MYQDLYFYIDLDWTKYLENQEIGFKNLFLLVDFAYQHKAKVYYSEEQLKDFRNNCLDLDLIFSESEGDKLDVILKDAEGLKQQKFAFEICFSSDKTSLNHIPNLSVSAIQNHEKQVILSSNLSQSTILLVSSNTEFEKVNVTYLDEIEDIRKWIVENSQKKMYNFSSKHGNASTKAIPPKPNVKVSQLKCSDEKAQQLLDTAICDLREKSWCYNFDFDLETFIVFPFEGPTPQNQFHAYHIDENEWKKEIPSSIRKFFEK